MLDKIRSVHCHIVSLNYAYITIVLQGGPLTDYLFKFIDSNNLLD